MVRLVTMGPVEFDPFLEHLTRSYAEEHIRAGRWNPEEGLAESRKEIQKLLPGGLETTNHFFYSIVGGSPEEKVGAIWLAIEPRGGFVYDLQLDDTFRRRGYAEEAMRLLEHVAEERGVRKISLHVFADNVGARKLYTKLGYVETNVVMSKTLAP
jgi:ribosomal protein S18 acetylase RimI-like enzyme